MNLTFPQNNKKKKMESLNNSKFFTYKRNARTLVHVEGNRSERQFLAECSSQHRPRP